MKVSHSSYRQISEEEYLHLAGARFLNNHLRFVSPVVPRRHNDGRISILSGGKFLMKITPLDDSGYIGKFRSHSIICFLRPDNVIDLFKIDMDPKELMNYVGTREFSDSLTKSRNNI